MGFAPLSYPAYRTVADDGIDNRLGKAHSHNNITVLQSLTDQDIIDIRNSMSKNINTWDVAAIRNLKTRLVNEQHLLEDVALLGQNKNYVRTDTGAWVELSGIPVNVTMESLSPLLSIARTENLFKFSLSSDIQTALDSIDQKMDKPTEYAQGQFAQFNSNGNVVSSGISAEQLVTYEDIVYAQIDHPGDETKQAPSVRSFKELMANVNNLTTGIGKPRGYVFNALTSKGLTHSVVEVSVQSSTPSNYRVGDIFGAHLSSIDATFVAKTVSLQGEVRELEILDRGANNAALSGEVITLYPITTASSSQKAVVAVITTDEIEKTTLSTVVNPAEGDSVYVIEDEEHDDVKTLWSYRKLNDAGLHGWCYVLSVTSELPIFRA